MAELAIIGGTGLTALPGLQILRRELVRTPFGEPSSALLHGSLEGKELVFLPRHGDTHHIPPHKINYRANIWALAHAGIRRVLAVAAVGGIAAELKPGDLLLPDQLIDYTWGRAHTFFEDETTPVVHVDFSEPYCETLRDRVLTAATTARVPLAARGCYAATQGPRLETAAEIDRLERDGCHVVGMTGMPEAGLARELKLCYGCVAVIVNAAAGRGDGEITMVDIERNMKLGLSRFRRLLSRLVAGD